MNIFYDQLNKPQKQAVDAIDGPVMVIAGPGTGKTQVLSARIANILLKTDTRPESILALTFTESAAANMRERLVSMIGKTGYYVQISTFHSFCKSVIDSYPEYFSIARESEPLSDLERYELFQTILLELDLDILKPMNAPLFYLKEAISSISNLKREGVSIERYKDILERESKEVEELTLENEGLKGKARTITKTALTKRARDLKKNQELLLIYKSYQEYLRLGARFDFDDMIAFVAESFAKHEILLSEYQENIHYFLIDEYQDTNSAQNKIVDLLAAYWGDKANVFTVGDPNQAIYRFQGASVENMLGFSKKYADTKVITLDIGYRCSQTLYDLSTDLVSENNLSLMSQGISFSTKVTSPHGEGIPVGIYSAPSQVLEIVYIAEEIKKLLKNGEKPEDIAILYRHNFDEAAISDTLDRWGIRYDIDGGSNVLTNETIRQLLVLFQVISDVRSSVENELVFEVMQYDWLDLDSLTVMQVGRAAGKADLSIIDLIQKGREVFDEHHVGTQVDDEEFAKLKIFVEDIFEWSSEDAVVTFNAWFEYIIKETGLLDWVQEQPDKIELLNNLNSLFGEIKALINRKHDLKLADFLQAIATIQEHGIKLKVEDLNAETEAVHLSTVHKAKGREWKYVFLIHVYDGKWGNNRKKELIKLPLEILENTDTSKKERNEDERRLFYVGLTRAKKQVIVTYPKTFISDNGSKTVVPSLFIEEIRESENSNLFTEIQAPEIIKNTDKYLEKLLTTPLENKITPSEEEFFTALVKNFKLSSTALNTYLKDPEEFKQNVLLRVPRAKPIPMIFGSAVHAALEIVYKEFKEKGAKPPMDQFLNKFEEALEKEPLTKDEFKKRLKYGRDILERYYINYQDETVNPLYIEHYIGSGYRTAALGDIYLTGRIDRIDVLDKLQKTVRVIDYKTGKAKSINEIEGKTASSNLSEREKNLPEGIRGPYKRQLLFYKLLTELDTSFNYKVSEGEFDFVEPSKQSGKFVRRRFMLSGEDVRDLKELIKEVMEEVRGLGFLG